MTEVAQERARTLLLQGKMEILGLMPDASNYTFLTTVRHDELEALAVYKPQAGETPLWDFPDGTLWRREVAAFELSEALGWGLVPLTVERDGPHGVGSLQLWVDAEPEEHYLTLAARAPDFFQRVAAFDVVANNADRKASHCLLERETERIWLIDHGVCFAVAPKLRTVIWEFADEPLPGDVLTAFESLAARMRGDDSHVRRLRELLAPDEVEALHERTLALLCAGRFPEPPSERRPYPWPPV